MFRVKTGHENPVRYVFVHGKLSYGPHISVKRIKMAFSLSYDSILPGGKNES